MPETPLSSPPPQYPRDPTTTLPHSSRSRRVSGLSNIAGGGGGGGAGGRDDALALLDSDDEDGLPAPAPKRRRKALTQEELAARAEAAVDALLESDGGSAPRNANKKDRDYAKRVLVAVVVVLGGQSITPARGGSASRR